MADRTVRVRLEAAVSGFQASMAQASASTRKFGGDVAQMSRTHREEMQTVGTAAAVLGGAMAAGLGASAKAAIDFESSFAGVRKTVDASEAEFAALSDGFRGLAREIPVSVNELNGIGEAAGQLGIAKENILGFTRTMADLGVATNLTSEEAATAFARFANITQMSQGDFDRLGSTVVDLGNNLATTEAEISAFGLRLAGAGAQVGMTEAEILGLGGALSSVGINAEAGGTAISKVMIEMATAVSSGGEELQMFAETAGMSAHQFAAAFRDDPASAIASFIEGLGRVDAAGGDLFATLEELGITEQRMRDAMLRTAGAGTLVADSMRRANTAWEENTALTAEAAQRYETLESRMTLAKNAIYDAGISLGQTLTPALGFAADAATGLAGGLADMPPVVQGTTAVLGGLTGSLSLAAGGFLLAAPRIIATKDALNALSTSMPGTVRALRGVGSLLTGPWGIALAGAITAVGLFASVKGEARRRSEEFAATLDIETGALTENSRAHVAAELSKKGLIDTGREFGLGVETLVDAMLGEEDALRRVAAATEENRVSHNNWGGTAEGAASSGGQLLSVLEQLGRENVETAAAARELAIAEAEAEGQFLDTAHAISTGVDPALASLAVQHQNAGESAGAAAPQLDEFGNALSDQEAAAAGAAEELENYADVVEGMHNSVTKMRDADEKLTAAEQNLNEVRTDSKSTTEDVEGAVLDLLEAQAGMNAESLRFSQSGGAASIEALREMKRRGEITGTEFKIMSGLVADFGENADTAIRDREMEIAVRNWRQSAAQLDAVERRAIEASRNRSFTITGTIRWNASRPPRYTGMGPADYYSQHTGGYAGTGPVRRYHAGGGVAPAAYAGLRPNEVPTILEREEFVVRKEQARKHGPLLVALNAGRMHEGGPVASGPLGGSPGGGRIIRVELPMYLDGRELGRSSALIDAITGEVRAKSRRSGGADPWA